MAIKNQNLSFLFLMDRYESLNLETETSLLCIDELTARGHRVYWLAESALSLPTFSHSLPLRSSRLLPS